MILRGKLFGIAEVVRYLRNPNPALTVQILRAFGANVGSQTTFKGRVFLDNVFEDANSAGDFSHLNIGDNCYLGDGLYFDLADRIKIGNTAVVSGQVSLITHADCGRSARLAQRFPRRCSAITINDGAWIGFGATIVCGVQIGAYAVVGAGSVLMRSTESASLYAGVPARKVRNIAISSDDTLRDLSVPAGPAR